MRRCHHPLLTTSLPGFLKSVEQTPGIGADQRDEQYSPCSVFAGNNQGSPPAARRCHGWHSRILPVHCPASITAPLAGEYAFAWLDYPATKLSKTDGSS